MQEKLREAVSSVIPIVIIVCVLVFTIAPISTDIMLAFVIGSIMLIVGLGIFMFGSENSMTLIGNHIGSVMTRSKNLFMILFISFFIGVIITMAEPDLQVLAGNVSHINSTVLIFTVSVGIGIFLMLCMIRILLGIQLKWLLIFFYGIIFVLAALSDPDYIAVAFDSGGVASGPMSATFMLPFAMGVCQATGGNLLTDAFGTVALVAMMPLITVQIMGVKYVLTGQKETAAFIEQYSDSDIIELWE